MSKSDRPSPLMGGYAFFGTPGSPTGRLEQPLDGRDTSTRRRRVRSWVGLAITLCVCGAVLAPPLGAQEPGPPEDVLEALLPDMEVGELPAGWEYWLSHPVDLNNASVEELEQLPFMDPMRAEAIVAWRTIHGPIQELDELVDAGLLTDRELRLIRMFVRLRGRARPSGEFRSRYRLSSLYPSYPGSYIRIQIERGERADLGSLIDRDPGERDWADFRCGYLTYQLRERWVVTLGDYSVDLGQGLMFAGPYAARPGIYFRGMLRPGGANHRGFRSSAENWLLRGAAVQYASARWKGLAFVSRHWRHGSVDRLRDLPVWDLDGYHRTSSEEARKGALREEILGAHASFAVPRVGRFGATLAAQRVAAGSGVGWTRVASGGDWKIAVPGGLWTGEVMTLKGGEHAIASQAYFSRRGFEVLIAGFATSGNVATWLRSNPFFLVDGGEATKGAVLGAAWERKTVRVAAVVTSQYAPTASPGEGRREDRQLQAIFRISRGMTFEARVRETPRLAEETVYERGGRAIERISRTTRRGLRLQLDAERGAWRSRLRGEANWLGDWSVTNPKGVLIYQQEQIGIARSLRVLLRFAIFDVSDPLAAVYAYEPDVPGTFYIRSFRSRGWQTLVMLRWRVAERLRFSAKAEWHRTPGSGMVRSASVQLDAKW